jgi:hypothetical protein
VQAPLHKQRRTSPKKPQILPNITNVLVIIIYASGNKSSVLRKLASFLVKFAINIRKGREPERCSKKAKNLTEQKTLLE